MSIKRPVGISTLSDGDVSRLQTLLQTLASAPKWKIVQVQHKNSMYWRRAPGAKKLLDLLGQDSFDLFGVLISLGIEVCTNSSKSTQSSHQRMGRAFLDVGISLACIECWPLFLVYSGASIIWPEKVDKFKTELFSRNIATDFLSDQILKFGGKQFREWSLKPNWIDFI